jgi:hypothetical protein
LKEKPGKKIEADIAVETCIGDPEKLFHDDELPFKTMPIPPEIFEVIRQT